MIIFSCSPYYRAPCFFFSFLLLCNPTIWTITTTNHHDDDVWRWFFNHYYYGQVYFLNYCKSHLRRCTYSCQMVKEWCQITLCILKKQLCCQSFHRNYQNYVQTWKNGKFKKFYILVQYVKIKFLSRFELFYKQNEWMNGANFLEF